MIDTTVPTVRTTPPTASMRETVSIATAILLPTLAKGVIIRRPWVVALAERLNLDTRAVRYAQRLRNKYGPGPLLLNLPSPVFRALILAPEHVHRVLNQSPEPFATASTEKRAALSHFQPKGVLISHGAERADRRRFNEAVLDTKRPVHRFADQFLRIVDEEAERMLANADHRGELAWNTFAGTWFPMVRRVVFGGDARDDQELTTLINRLRSDANWAFFRPKRRELRTQFYDRLQSHLQRAEPNSLASIMAATPTTPNTAPEQQVPQWLFAFDPAGMTTFRTLALLATHPEHAQRVRDEIKEHEGTMRQNLPYLRACILESLRLWPTTPMVLRESTEPTTWETGTLPANTGLIIFANFFHRDDQRLPYAHRFVPELWLHERSEEDWPLIPFSAGPAVCPGQNLVLLLSSAMISALIKNRQIKLKPPARLRADRPLPGTLNNYALRFQIDG